MTMDSMDAAQPANAGSERGLAMSTVALEKNPTFWYYGSASIAYGIKNNAFSYLLLIYANQVLGCLVTRRPLRWLLRCCGMQSLTFFGALVGQNPLPIRSAASVYVCRVFPAANHLLRSIQSCRHVVI